MPEKDNGITKYITEYLNPHTGSSAQLIVFSEANSQRLIYTLDFVLKKVLKINFSVTNNESEFKASSLPKLNYSSKISGNVLNIEPSGLLFETEVKNFVPDSFKKNDLIYFFPVQKGDLEYDIFSAVFYFISRYEEWLPFEKDSHGRFELKNSILYKNNFHKTPVVDFWIRELKEKLESKFKELKFPLRSFKLLSTIDVDNVYAYKAKPGYRVGGALVKDILKLDFKNFNERIKTVFFNKPDPFDAYDLQIEISKKYNIPLIYFFLYRNNTEYDRTIHPSHPEFIKLLKKISSNDVAIGIHPSYKSSENNDLIKKEIELLNQNSGKKIICSRQHYLRFNIETTPHQLIENGIQYDFTMGFASGLGFRAGTTLPFNYFDQKKNKILPLIAIPFAVMDGVFFIYDQKTVNEAEKEIMEVMNIVKRANGLFVTVFHERTFSESFHPGWKELYLKIHNIVN